MKDEVEIIEKPEYISFEDITELLHESFEYWLKKGIEFTAAKQTVDITRRRVGNGKCFVCMIDDILVGTFFIAEYKKGITFGQLAVSPNYQNKGIATKCIDFIERYAYLNGYKYIQGDTSIKAKWLLSWYLNKVGYKKYSIRYNIGRKYFSIFFRKYIHKRSVPQILINSYCFIHYIISIPIIPISLTMRILKMVIRKSIKTFIK